MYTLADCAPKKLQRAIADYRGISYERLIGSPAQEGLSESGRAPESSATPSAGGERTPGPPPETKRKYRRHPKPDDNAPERPPSAYVIFSNRVREEVKDQNLSFTQIAKLVGDRWQKLDPAGKEPFEVQANAAKERYNIQLSTYRKTDAYKEYMQYLAEFKSKHAQVSEPKRPKLDPESSGSIMSVKSLDTNPEAISQASGHVRGGSVGSISSSFTGIPMYTNASAAALPSRPALASSRSGSPPSLQHGRDYFRPGLLSSHSSVSDESSTHRSDMPEPLVRAAGLSLGTNLSGTPPLPPSAPGPLPLETMGSPDLLARARLTYFLQQQQQQQLLQQQVPQSSPSGPAGQISSTTSLPPTFPSPNMQEATWRNRPPDSRGYPDATRPILASLPYPLPGAQQLNPSQLQRRLTPDRPPDFNPGPNLRTLPPPRPPSTGASSLAHIGPTIPTNEYFRRPPRSEHRPALDRSESDAASTLAGLAGAAHPETPKPLNQPPPPSSPL